MDSPALRAARIAAAAKERETARTWWTVALPKLGAIQVAFNPPQTRAEVERRYPGAIVTAGAGEGYQT